MSIAISYKIYHLYNSRQRQEIIIGQLSYYGSRQRLKKLPLKMSKKNSFCCILYYKAHKGCLKTEIYVLLHRLKKCIVNLYPAMQNSKPRYNLVINRDCIPALVTSAGYDIEILFDSGPWFLRKKNVKHLKTWQ